MYFSSLAIALLTATAWGQDVSDVSTAEPFGLETTISSDMLKAMNPLLLSMMKQVLENLEVSLPDQVYTIPNIGSLKTHFEKMRCNGFSLDNNPEFIEGMYFDEGYLGFSLAFDLACRGNFSTNVKFVPQGWINASLKGSKVDTRLNFNYVPESRSLMPDIEKLDIKFQSVDIQMDNHPIANFIARTFRKLLPPITSAVIKRTVRLMVPGLVQSVMDTHFAIPDGHGSAQMFHTEFLSQPEITKDGLTVKMTIAAGDGHPFGGVSSPKDVPEIDALAAENAPQNGKHFDLKSHLLGELKSDEEEEPTIESDIGEDDAPQEDLEASASENEATLFPDDEAASLDTDDEGNSNSESTIVNPIVTSTEEEKNKSEDAVVPPILPSGKLHKDDPNKRVKDMKQRHKNTPAPSDILQAMDDQWEGKPSVREMGRSNEVI